MTIQMNQLFELVHKIPQVPEVVKTLIIQLNNPNADILSIVKNVEKEQTLALKVLRLVNSAHFGLSKKVDSINEATMMLGTAQLKTLVIASGIVSAVGEIPNFNIKQFWNSGFQSAAYAKWFAETAGLDVDIAYTAAMLSNLGQIIIRLGLPKEANEIDQHVKAGRLTRAEVEINKLGFTNQAVCGELCRRWKLGEVLIDAIEQSGQPLAAATPNRLACTIFLGNHISACQMQGMEQQAILDNYPDEVSALIGIDRSSMQSKLASLLSIESKLAID